MLTYMIYNLKKVLQFGSGIQKQSHFPDIFTHKKFDRHTKLPLRHVFVNIFYFTHKNLSIRKYKSKIKEIKHYLNGSCNKFIKFILVLISTSEHEAHHWNPAQLHHYVCFCFVIFSPLHKQTLKPKSDFLDDDSCHIDLFWTKLSVCWLLKYSI